MRIGFCITFLYASLVVTSSFGVVNDKYTFLQGPPKRPARARTTTFLHGGGVVRPKVYNRKSYSLELSTAENYKSTSRNFYGRYAKERSELDYNYHDNFIETRQYLQDSIIDSILNNNATWIIDKNNGKLCNAPKHPWIVFTAGAMGAGKSYTVKRLAKQGRLPLHSFVTVDPDEIRRLLPEFDLYVQYRPETAGEMTRKEAGYISEVVIKVALERGCNVLVDGSLRDSTWYKLYFAKLRTHYSKLRIGILHVTAPPSAVFARARQRSKRTGRIVPFDTLQHSLNQVPQSVETLKPLADFFAQIHNAPGDSSSELELRTPGLTWESFQAAWAQSCT